MIYTLMSIYLFAHATTSAGGQCSSGASKADVSDRRVKLSILSFKASFTHVTVSVSAYVCVLFTPGAGQLSGPEPRSINGRR